MPAVAFALPVALGSEQHSRQLIEALMGGEEGAAAHDRRSAHRFRRVRVWRQHTPQEMTVVYLEADELEQAIRNMAAEDHEHHTWFADKVAAIVGRHPHDHASHPEVEPLVDWHPQNGPSRDHHD